MAASIALTIASSVACTVAAKSGSMRAFGSIATRAALGVGRMGGRGENSSGDIFVAFSTANAGAVADTGVVRVQMLPNARINALFAATVQATEAAIVNALLAAETMTGVGGFRVHALPRDRMLAALRKYGRAK